MKGQDDTAHDGSQPWYVAEGTRGQQLLDQGQIGQAREVFESTLTRLGGRPSYARAVILGRLGRCFHLSGRLDIAIGRLQEALEVLGKLAPSDGVKGLRGTLRSDLGDALRADGRHAEARRAYEAALKIAEALKDLRGQGVELGRLGALALAEGKLEEALAREQAALRLFQQLHEPEMEAAAWHQLAKVYHEQRRWDEAEQHYLEAARLSEEHGHAATAARTWNRLACLNNLARLLQHQPGRLADARQLAEEALAVAQTVDAAAPEVWRHYGVLADIIQEEARNTIDDEQRAALEGQARDYHELRQRAPTISATLAQVGASPSYGRSVILGQLARCLHMGRRPDLGAACAREAIGDIATLAPDDGLKSLSGSLHADLGDMLRAMGQDASAAQAFEVALEIAEDAQDLRGQAHALRRLGRNARARRPRDEASAFEVTLYDDLTTDFVFETDLLIDGPRERQIIQWTQPADPLASDVRPMQLPCARVWVDDVGAVRFGLPPTDPVVAHQIGCIVMRRVRREVAVSGSSSVLWELISQMNGARTVAEIVTRIPTADRATAASMLAALAATGAIDVSGRPVGRLLHRATKKGVLPAGGLEGDAVLRLATDGSYRAYPKALRLAVSQVVPDRLRIFHALTRSRRSRRDFGGPPLARNDFDALLHTACGITGVMPWEGREVKLRAYPSSGALYAVEIYPVVFRVEGLDPAVYHYRAPEHVLEVVRQGLDPARFVSAALPVEREMVAGAAALFCLTGCLPRHEKKYGEGGYRMLVAETGHISQNLILAATAMRLNARPFGGVFDDLYNRELGLHGEDEQFLLAVLVGHTGQGRG